MGADPEGLAQYWATADNTCNYASVTEHRAEVENEINRLAAKGFVTVYESWDDLRARLGEVVVSRMAAVLKVKPDGTRKVRLIVDMRRSGVNSFVKAHERVVLPRLRDAVSDAVAMAAPGVGADKGEDADDEVGPGVLDGLASPSLLPGRGRAWAYWAIGLLGS